MTLRSLVSIAFVAVALVGCSSSSTTGSGGRNDSVPAGATLIKAEEAISWDSKTYTATAVDGKATISLRNESALPHNLHLLNSANVDVGLALDVQGRGNVHTGSIALKPGTYQVVCTIPGHGNMKATLTVN